MRILIVDDEQSLALTLQANLELDGFEVDTASSGAEALELVRRNDYGLMLSDIRMPGMNGVDLFREVRATRPLMPVILMTAFAIEGLVSQAIDEGVFTVFPKPFDIEHLEGVLLRALQQPLVLIVDHASGDAEQTANALESAGLRARAVTDADSAVRAVREAAVDVCVVDLLLSERGGAALLEELRGAAPGLMFIAVSGYDVPELMQRIAALGTVACMRKPIAAQELVHTIARARRLPAPSRPAAGSGASCR